LYMRIKVVDCLDKAWSRDKASQENNIKKMIHHANKVPPLHSLSIQILTSS
jgi:hypothetical protein